MGHSPSGPVIQPTINSLPMVVAASGWDGLLGQGSHRAEVLCPGVSPEDPTSHQHLFPHHPAPFPSCWVPPPPGEWDPGESGPAVGPRPPRVSMAGQCGGPWVPKRVLPAPDSKRVCLQLKTQLERTEALLGDEQTRRQKLTAEFEEVRVLLS